MYDHQEVIIIGAGLSGLTLAHLLSKQNIGIRILEASDRIGGRIQTSRGKLDTPLELGATWFSDIHTNLLSLLDELGLKKFPQYSGGISLFQTKSFEPAQGFYVPGSDAPSYRIAGGTQALTEALYQTLSPGAVHSNSQVYSIQSTHDHIIVKTSGNRVYKAQKVVICLPPQLAAAQIQISPDLPADVLSLLPGVQTWMAGAIKFVVEYDKAFWKENGYSGMLYSHAGIITEMYDHTNFQEDKFGFTGFLNGGAAAYSFETRKELVMEQLTTLFGAKAAEALGYYDKIWTDKYILAGNPVVQRPHQNNGHPLLQASYLNGSLFFCGTETAIEYPGYMEGAIIAAKAVFQKL